MKATEAKILTEQNLKGPVIEPLMAHVYALIKNAANSGKSTIMDPLSGLRCPIFPEQREAVYNQLRMDGYSVVDHPDPDPGHVASRPYTTVSW